MRKLSLEATEQASLWRRCRCVVHADGSRDRKLDRDQVADGEACAHGVASITWRHTHAAVGLAVQALV